MFNRREHIYHFPRPTEVTKKVTIKEQRAPTDESVRLLMEMEEAARERITGLYVLEGNDLNGVVETFTDFASGTEGLRCIFDLNGDRLTATSTLNWAQATRSADAEAELWTQLRDNVAKAIANKLLLACINDSTPYGTDSEQ